MDSAVLGNDVHNINTSAYGSETKISANKSVKYDLIGKLVDETGLTRRAIVDILKGIQPQVFNQFKDNPEEFILKAADLINDEKATAIIQHITYNILDEQYETDIFTEPALYALALWFFKTYLQMMPETEVPVGNAILK